jgi:hypothetical protein
MRSVTGGLLAAIAIVAVGYAGDGLYKWRAPNGVIYVGDTPPPGSVDIGSSEGVFGDPAEEERIEAEIAARDRGNPRAERAEAHFRELETTYRRGPEGALAQECLRDSTKRGTTDWIAADSCSRRRIAALQAG